LTTIRFIQHDGREQDIDATDGDSIMRAANDHGVPGILADCGGCLTCATCHVYVPEGWFDRLDPPSADETAMLEGAVDPHPNSRLSCQIAVSPALEGLTVHVPKNQF
jgi:2Fe-2S ferredoxin